MTTASQIDAAMRNFAIDVAFGDQAQRIKSGDALRDLIASALADARREGAEQMRGACLRECREIEEAHRAAYKKKYSLHAEGASDGATDCAAMIDALPLPTGKRQAVLLTDEQVTEVAARHWGRADIAPRSVCGFARSIESAVFSANNLEVRRG